MHNKFRWLGSKPPSMYIKSVTLNPITLSGIYYNNCFSKALPYNSVSLNTSLQITLNGSEHVVLSKPLPIQHQKVLKKIMKCKIFHFSYPRTHLGSFSPQTLLCLMQYKMMIDRLLSAHINPFLGCWSDESVHVTGYLLTRMEWDTWSYLIIFFHNHCLLDSLSRLYDGNLAYY